MVLLYIKVLLKEHPLHLLRNQTYTPSLIDMDGGLLGSFSHLFENMLLIFMSPVFVSHTKKVCFEGRKIKYAAIGGERCMWAGYSSTASADWWKTFKTEGLSTKLHT